MTQIGLPSNVSDHLALQGPSRSNVMVQFDSPHDFLSVCNGKIMRYKPIKLPSRVHVLTFTIGCNCKIS